MDSGFTCTFSWGRGGARRRPSRRGSYFFAALMMFLHAVCAISSVTALLVATTAQGKGKQGEGGAGLKGARERVRARA